MELVIAINLIAAIIAYIFLQKKYAKISKHRIHSIIDGILYGIGANALSPLFIGIGIAIFEKSINVESTPEKKDLIVLFSISTILAPYWEELLFRGWILDKITKLVNFKFSAIFTTLLFPLLHIQTPQLFFSLLTLSTSCLILKIRHKSVTPAIICHSIFNAASLSVFI